MDNPDGLHKDKNAMSFERIGRLHRLAILLSGGPVDKIRIMQKLDITIRTFYLDLITLEEVGLQVLKTRAGYLVTASQEEIEQKLPFPIPILNISEARSLAEGTSPAAKRIEQQLYKITNQA